jgi:hypothetical protein
MGNPLRGHVLIPRATLNNIMERIAYSEACIEYTHCQVADLTSQLSSALARISELQSSFNRPDTTIESGIPNNDLVLGPTSCPIQTRPSTVVTPVPANAIPQNCTTPQSSPRTSLKQRMPAVTPPSGPASQLRTHVPSQPSTATPTPQANLILRNNASPWQSPHLDRAENWTHQGRKKELAQE